MAYAEPTFMRDDPTILQRRFTAYVHPYPAKVLARSAGCSERTAEAWRAGRSWPTARHWLYLVANFGRDLTDCVFHPDVAAARLAEEVADLERQLQQRQAALRLVEAEARSFSSARPEASPGHENRAAALAPPQEDAR